MAITGTPAQIVRQMEAVAARLDSTKITGPQRMALLRRQADLGDLRDMFAERARRANAAR